jgi:D-alanyl-D-alanine carboxypeptidase/D-alanyl-D-alanine-endopeptidase (penicillin-binding protein 4)
LRKLLFLPIIILLVPAQVGESFIGGKIKASRAAAQAQSAPLQALARYKEILESRGQRLDDQGILIETLEGDQVLAEHNADIAFNPASVMKLATSLVALVKLGPDFRYRTDILADGAIDAAARKLEGDLVVAGGTDPMFSADDAQEVAAELSRIGISRVTGALRVAGPFYYYARGYTSNLSRETSAAKLRAAIERAGIKIEGPTVFGERAGAPLLAHYSDELLRILFYQNAHSSNAVAEVLGESLGGPAAVQDYLVNEVGIEESEIFVTHTSGLDVNRITPRASLKMLRALMDVLDQHGLKPEDAMPVAGVDSGTLRVRLAGEGLRGSVVAKTGTLVSIDSGVSTLVGIAYTRERGPLLFAVFNSAGSVNYYRRLQDDFIESVIAEKGGPAPVSRSEDALADTTRRSIIQVVYKNQGQPSETAAE